MKNLSIARDKVYVDVKYHTEYGEKSKKTREKQSDVNIFLPLNFYFIIKQRFSVRLSST